MRCPSDVLIPHLVLHEKLNIWIPATCSFASCRLLSYTLWTHETTHSHNWFLHILSHIMCDTLSPPVPICLHTFHTFIYKQRFIFYLHIHVCVNIYKLFRLSLPLLSTLSLHHSRLLLLRLPSFIQAAGAKTLKSFSLSSWLHWDAFQEPSEIPGPLAESKQHQAKRLPSWLPQHLLDTLEILIASNQTATFKTHLRQNHQIAL